ncbi:MAG: hypothetical protein KatS3mg077_0950 [Candidatus Binatia bacterium]|nr:MAG: hypothetical protein KatS3mg077_0950 [Candidatus Binatia bacterium]
MVLASLFLATRGTLAHGGRAPFTFWGGFTRSAFPCQKAIARAARLCAVRTVELRQRCSRNSDLPTCSPDQVEARRRTIELQSLDLISAACNDRAAVEVGFLGTIEAQSDIATVCSRVDRDLRDFFDLAARAASDDRTCANTVAGSLTQILRTATDLWVRAFDRMAFKVLAPSRKNLLVTRTRQRISLAAAKLAHTGNQNCRESFVLSTFGEPLEQLLSRPARLAECVTGAAFVQDAVHCDPNP